VCWENMKDDPDWTVEPINDTVNVIFHSEAMDRCHKNSRFYHHRALNIQSQSWQKPGMVRPKRTSWQFPCVRRD